MAKILLDVLPQNRDDCPFFVKVGFFGTDVCGVKPSEYIDEDRWCHCSSGDNFDFSYCPFCKIINYDTHS